jgi:hypothetical protein
MSECQVPAGYPPLAPTSRTGRRSAASCQLPRSGSGRAGDAALMRELALVLAEIHGQGKASFKKIADTLALRGIPSPTGKLVWEVNQVRIAIGRFEREMSP